MAAQTPANYILDQVTPCSWARIQRENLFYPEFCEPYWKVLPYSLCHLSALQCNILFSARRYKLQLFTGFRRQVVVVFPSADEWKRRLSQHQTSDGEQIPETALLKLQGLTYISVINNKIPQCQCGSIQSKHAHDFCHASLPLSSELQSSRAAERPVGGAAVCRAASGAGTDAPAGV